MTLREIRNAPGAAWVGPLLIFSIFMALPAAVGSDAPDAPWYRAQPKQWVFPLQTVFTLAAVAFWWPCYTLRPLSTRIVLAGILAGTIGIALWILPSWLFDRGYVPEFEWLGFTSRAGDKESFNPDIWAGQPGAYWSAVLMRLLRMTVAVAFAEELFWRGFLWRTISDPYRDFSKVPFGQASWKAFGAVLGLFVVMHGRADYLGAIIYVSIISLLYVRTRSIGACVIAHGISNLILGIYVLTTRQWGFW